MLLRSLSIVQQEFTFANSPLWQFWVLLRRSHRQFLRDYRAAIVGLLLTLTVAVIIGIMFLQLGTTQQAIEDRMGVLFFSVVFLTFSSSQPVLDIFPAEQARQGQDVACQLTRPGCRARKPHPGAGLKHHSPCFLLHASRASPPLLPHMQPRGSALNFFPPPMHNPAHHQPGACK